MALFSFAGSKVHTLLTKLPAKSATVPLTSAYREATTDDNMHTPLDVRHHVLSIP